MVKALSAFLDFCYLVRCLVIDEDALDAIDDALLRFHRDRVIFEDAGVRADGFSLPRQHSAKHYCALIEEFGAPNGICSSITESKHIKAVKELWRRSSRFDALGQMLLTNQRLDKLAASHVDFNAHGMLQGPCLAPYIELLLPGDDDGDVDDDVDDDEGPAHGPKVLATVTLAKCPGMSYLLVTDMLKLSVL